MDSNPNVPSPSPSILIVEDDPALLFGLRDNFEREGYRVRTAVEGHLGLELARSLMPDLVLLDIMLPGIDGFRICRELRESGREMPIVMLTALGQEDKIVEGLDLGADDYVTKPFRIRELIARVGALLRRRLKERAEIAVIGPCTYDRTARELRRDGAVQDLTPKETGLLKFLLDRPHRALTRNQILDAVWGMDNFVTDRSVDRVVTLLRRKLEPDPARPRFIRTVQKIGYRFEPEG